VEYLRPFGQQVENVTVGVLNAGLTVGCHRFCEVIVDGGKEPGELPGAGSGGHDSLLVVTELGQDELKVTFLLVAVNLGEELALRATGPGPIALPGGGGNIVDSNLCGEQTTAAVGQFDLHRSS